MNNSTNKSVSTLIHITVWIGFVSIPYWIGYFTHSEQRPFDIKSLIMPLQIMGWFYLNYLFLINKLLFKDKVWQFITLNLVLVVGFSITIVMILSSLYPDAQPHAFPDPMRKIIPFFINLIIQSLVIGLSVAIKMTGQWYEARQRVQELEKANAETELQHLKSQLNPHFLFNSLNNIYALIAFNPDKAQLSLTNLCELLRYQLYEANREIIPLEKEIEFVRSYCDLMKLRLADNVKLEVQLPTDTQGIAIAPLLFVSIIENAFKHGISQNKPSNISIHIYIDNDNVHCWVRNIDYPKKDNDRSGSGIGLENLHRRLELLYPHTHFFNAEKVGSEFIAQLRLKVKG